MTTTTPAMERATAALKAATGVTYPWALDVAPKMLGAALDAEEMAQTLYDELAQRVIWSSAERCGEVADALAAAIRASILGKP